jgi:hypothetical protein
MSSAVVSTSAALRRPFIFDEESEPEVCSVSKAHAGPAFQACPEHSRADFPIEQSSIARRQDILHSTLNHPHSKIPPSSITPASQLGSRPAPEMVPTGIPALDAALAGGLPRGCLTEICGPASSGRTAVLLAALAAATRRGEFCAVVDASDALDPHSAAAAGVDLDHLLWVRCGEDSPQRHRDTEKQGNQKDGCPISRAPFAREVGIFGQTAFNFDGKRSRSSDHCLEQVLRATDLLLESGGFGLIILDLADLPPQSARRIPLTTWFRFRRAVENKPTILLAIEQHPIAGSCSSLLLQLGAQNFSGKEVSEEVISEEKISEEVISEEEMDENQSHSSRKAAAWESPARKCRVSTEKKNESRRDGTNAVDASANHHPSAQITHPTHANLLTELNINAELIRSRLDRKPARSVMFATKTAWAG